MGGLICHGAVKRRWETMMEYLSVAQARGMKGLRLVLSAGVPGPWGIAAKAIFQARGVPYVPVRQVIMDANEDLVAWTGRRNAPIAVYDDEPGLDNWLDIVMLAERLGSGPSLLPDDPVEEALALGFSAQICGHGGYGWSRRLGMARPETAPLPDDMAAKRGAMMRGYGAGAGDMIAAAPQRAITILHGLARQLHRQREMGSDYLVGSRLSACDLHWAAFSQMAQPLTLEECPFPPGMREMYDTMPPEVRAACDPILIEHRDRIFARHIGLPMEF
jgi:glutathione S-transferase